jgi:hypothetical protein
MPRNRNQATALAGGYAFDVFLSYPRHEPVRSWVHLHFFPRLREWLTECLGEPPSIFFDQDEMTAGVSWPLRLQQALLRSKILVPVLSAAYFQRPWCLAEWSSMREREKTLGLRTSEKPHGLILPVVFFDGDSFPEDARSIQHCDLRDWNVNTPGFLHTEAYVHFVKRVQEFARQVHAIFAQVPRWQEGWPIVQPSARRLPPMRLPRL